MERRLFLCIAAVASSLAAPFAGAQAVGAAARLAVIVTALGEAGTALSKLTQGLRDAAVAGSDAYEHVTAARARDRLVELSVKLGRLTNVGNEIVLDSLAEYIHLARTTPGSPDLGKHWTKLIADLAGTVRMVREILGDLEAERSDFVLEPAYRERDLAMRARSSRLSGLAALPPPVSADAIAELEKIREAYVALHRRTRELIEQLNAYIKRLK